MLFVQIWISGASQEEEEEEEEEEKEKRRRRRRRRRRASSGEILHEICRSHASEKRFLGFHLVSGGSVGF
jgi:hypothetical protein